LLEVIKVQSLEDKVILITGASAGIGEATARRLAPHRVRLVLTARRRERLDSLRNELEKVMPSSATQEQSGRILSIPADITSSADREKIVGQSIARFGRIDGLINNAGFGTRGPIELVPLAAIRANFDVNLFALIGLTQLVLPYMRAQRHGYIINVSSVAGRIARPFSSVYDATKHALEAVSDGLRNEVAAFGIRIVVIEPGLILTDFQRVAEEISSPLFQDSHPYQPLTGSFHRSFEKVRHIAVHPEEVAKEIVAVLKNPRPRARYAVPRHARIFLRVRWLLSDRLFDALLRRVT
jgi:short-subunit dehydrogenase